MKIKAKKLTVIALSVSLAMIFSFVESQIPPLAMVPGVKIGLANIVTVFLLYSLGVPETVIVSLIRVFLSSLLFGYLKTLIYSACGAAASFVAMLIAKKITPFGTVGVSVIGAVMHNAGQVAAACLVMGTAALAVYFIPLIITGTLSGVIIGIIAGIVARRVSRFVYPKRYEPKPRARKEKIKSQKN